MDELPAFVGFQSMGPWPHRKPIVQGSIQPNNNDILNENISASIITPEYWWRMSRRQREVTFRTSYRQMMLVALLDRIRMLPRLGVHISIMIPDRVLSDDHVELASVFVDKLKGKRSKPSRQDIRDSVEAEALSNLQHRYEQIMDKVLFLPNSLTSAHSLDYCIIY